VIKKFTVDVDAGSFGLPVVAFLTLAVVPGKIPEAAAQISKLNSVVEIHQAHTLGDLLINVRAKDLDELGDTVANRIRNVDSISVSNVVPVLKIWKDASA
jgi:DNA-binding Lrp family transcriptional regulator